VKAEFERESRKAYLDGLRGWAACLVLANHLSLALAIPLGILWLSINGNFGVCIFFILSGYVLASLSRNSMLSLSAQTIRRYLRLSVPILVTSAFAWALLATGAYHNKAAGEIIGSWWIGAWYQFELSFKGAVWQSLYGCFVDSTYSINGNLWTMKPELIGSFYIFLINALSGNRLVRALFLLSWAAFNLTVYYPLFAAGALLFEFETELRAFYERAVSNPALKGLAILVLFSVAIYLGGMPEFQPKDALGTYGWVYTWLPRFASDNSMRWHQIAALALMVAVLMSPMLQSIFGSTLGRYLGRVSFVMYLFQIPVICSYTAWVVLTMSKAGLPLWLVMATAAISTVALIFVVSNATHRLIDENGVKFSRWAGRQFDLLFPTQRPSPLLEQNKIMLATDERTSIPASP
jgi:peptidoglycan/LPS O-acetylase OafA/YrhL